VKTTMIKVGTVDKESN